MGQSETFWLTVLIQVQTIFILAGVVIFFMIPRPGRREFIELGIILMISLAVEVIGSIGVHILHTNMNLAPNIYDLLNLPLAVLLYRKMVHWKNINSIATVSIIVFVSFGLVNLFFIQGPLNFNSYTSSLASVCFIVISLTYFYVLIQQLPTESITKLPMFWINTGMLIYYSGTFMLYLTADYLINVLNNDLIMFWMLHHFIGLAFQSILAYGLLLIRAEYLAKQPVPTATN